MTRRVTLVLVLLAAAVALPGRANAQSGEATITVVIDIPPLGGGGTTQTNFPFGFGVPQELFFLDDDADPALPNSRTFVVEPGSYPIVQSTFASFATEVECDVTGPEVAAPTAVQVTVAVEAGDDVTCTFTNTSVGSMLALAVLTGPGDDPTDVEIVVADDSGPLRSVVLDDDADPTRPNLAPVFVPAGSYDLSVAAPDGLGAACVPLSPAGAVGEPPITMTAEVSVEVDVGDAVACVFFEPGSLTAIVEIPDTVDHVARLVGQFVVGAYLDTASLDDEPASALPDSLTVAVPPGDMGVAQALVDGWTTTLDCDAPTTDAPQDGFLRESVAIGAGEQVTCTFTNTFTSAMLILGVHVLPDGDPQDFELALDDDDTRPNLLLDDDHDDATLPNNAIATVAPGTYSFAELPTPGWAVDHVTCVRFAPDAADDEAVLSVNLPAAAVELEPGDTVQCGIFHTRVPLGGGGAGGAPPPPAPACPTVPSPFADVGAGDTHAAGILCMAGLGVIVGLEDGTFGPARLVTRQQVASMLDRLAGVLGALLPKADLPFEDVEGVHAGAVARLAAAGILRGAAPGRFDPVAPMSRGQLASVLAAFLDRLGPGVLASDGSDAFDDDDGTVHEAAIDRLAAAGVVTGREDGTFGPSDLVTRAETASLLARAFQLLG